MNIGTTLRKILFLIAMLTCPAIGQDMVQSEAGNLIPNASFLGLHYVERIGYALDGGGDVNGDGYDDFVIGTFHNGVVGQDGGAVYLILGSSRLTRGMNTSLSNADARFLGAAAFDAAGYSVACNGDLNGDGFDDFIIGAPAGNDSKPNWPGKVYIVFGNAGAAWGNYFYLGTSSNVVFDGENGQDLAGLSVAYIGDLNDDGYDDFLCGAPFNDQYGAGAGKAYLVLGEGGAWDSHSYLSESDASFIFDRDGSEVGYSVAGVGDINNDGTPDLAIGAMGASKVFILYGRKNVSWGMDFNLRNADLQLYGREKGEDEGIGWRIAGNGDLNGDGISDVMISAIHNHQGGQLAGKVYVLFGKNGGWVESELSLESGDASYIGENSEDYAGWGLSLAGDVNQDGFDDFLIGAWYNDQNGADAGKAYLINGKSSGWVKDVRLEEVTDYFLGEREINYAGFAVSTVGDFDGDGISDYIVSSPYNSEVQQWSGEVHLFASQEIPYYISGTINYTLTDQKIPRVAIQSANEPEAIAYTTWAGNYTLSVTGKMDHLVFAAKGSGEHTGAAVTSYDAALISRLAVGLGADDPVNSDAADVNLDSKITMYDAANVLRYAVSLPPLAGSHAGDWKFQPQQVSYSYVVNDFSNQNYDAYIVGDVDASWTTPDSGLKKQLFDGELSSRKIVASRGEISIPIEIPAQTRLLSFDVAMNYDAELLEFVRIDRNASLSDFNIALNTSLPNKLIAGGFSVNEVNVSQTLLTVVFKPRLTTSQNAQVSFDRVAINNSVLHFSPLEIEIGESNRVPATFALLQNYPNPFNNATAIPLHVAQFSRVTVSIYNALGEHVTTLVDENLNPGAYQLSWDGTDQHGVRAASGVYICKAAFPSATQHMKLIYMK
ncbi:MAG: FlgD immunoglobulin-like domain containing protein [Candidatus Zhuqueibacterota bacterium]